MRLPFGGQLAQAVEVPFHLVDDVAARAGIVSSEQIRIALGVVGRVEAADRPIHPTAQGGDGIGYLAANHIVRVAMDRAVAVSHRQGLA